MVKRLHLGRASEAGVMAASLAAGGFEAPRTVIEGEFGFLKVFCTEWDESLLTRRLGSDFVTMSAVLKRYPCHATAHAPVKAVRDLQAEHGFTGGEVASITIVGTPRMAERHNIQEPSDLMLAQYSIPFCVALALFREARDPESYDESALADRAIRALCRRVSLLPGASEGTTGTIVTIELTDGRWLERIEAGGMLEAGELPDKFNRLTRRVTYGSMAGVYKRLMGLEDEATLDWLG
jgi:2-methylcitrate dehydratase PrpD